MFYLKIKRFDRPCIDVYYRKRLNNRQSFLHVFTLFMYEVHACIDDGLLFKRLR